MSKKNPRIISFAPYSYNPPRQSSPQSQQSPPQSSNNPSHNPNNPHHNPPTILPQSFHNLQSQESPPARNLPQPMLAGRDFLKRSPIRSPIKSPIHSRIVFFWFLVPKKWFFSKVKFALKVFLTQWCLIQAKNLKFHEVYVSADFYFLKEKRRGGGGRKICVFGCQKPRKKWFSEGLSAFFKKFGFLIFIIFLLCYS